jgi:hypothetical protein
MIGAIFQTVTCDPGGRIGVPARELVNAFVGRRSRFARSSRPANLSSQRANSRISWQSAFGYGSLTECRPSGEYAGQYKDRKLRSLATLSRELGINPKTVSKWRKRIKKAALSW